MPLRSCDLFRPSLLRPNLFRRRAWGWTISGAAVLLSQCGCLHTQTAEPMASSAPLHNLPRPAAVTAGPLIPPELPGEEPDSNPSAVTGSGWQPSNSPVSPPRLLNPDAPSRSRLPLAPPPTDSEESAISQTSVEQTAYLLDEPTVVDVEAASKFPQPPRRFEVPTELPGADAEPLRLPPFDSRQPLVERRELLHGLFPDIPAVSEGAIVPPASALMTLTELQDLAVQHSPVIQQAVADIDAARGAAVQAGLYPNPTTGLQSDSINTAKTDGYNGVFVSQEFVTAGKLTLAQNAALMELQAEEAALRKARVTLASDVRRHYFRVLIAQERVRFSRALARLSDEVYQAQIDLVAGGENAPYEPLQLRVLAVQARNSVLQAETQLGATWRQLAATMGVPDLPRSEVEGSIDIPLPAIDYEQARQYLLHHHSDLAAANSRISAAQFTLCLQQAKPIPNIFVDAVAQADDTSSLNDMAYNIKVGIPVPLFDRNQGNISTANAQLTRSHQNYISTENQLSGQLAEIHGRYTAGTAIARTYRSDILQDQVRVYRGIYDRFHAAGETIDFAQVVIAQQALAEVISSYLDAMSTQWSAAVDLAEILQVQDMFAVEQELSQSH